MSRCKNSRRQFLGYFFMVGAGIAGLTCASPASTYGRVLQAGKPKLIKGNPNKVDFGHGLLVPMSKEAFETLWEGDDRWIAYGHGFGRTVAAAMGQAEEAATGTMKLFLLTQAFAPDRLTRIDGGGWRLKSGKTEDLIKGNIDLPGRPIMPATDRVNGAMASEATTDVGEDAFHATTGWVVWKSDISLDVIRKTARLIPAVP